MVVVITYTYSIKYASCRKQSATTIFKVVQVLWYTIHLLCAVCSSQPIDNINAQQSCVKLVTFEKFHPVYYQVKGKNLKVMKKVDHDWKERTYTE